MNIYLVTNGTGGEVDNAYTLRTVAAQRAASLNRRAGEALQWSVLPITLFNVVNLTL